MHARTHVRTQASTHRTHGRTHTHTHTHKHTHTHAHTHTVSRSPCHHAALGKSQDNVLRPPIPHRTTAKQNKNAWTARTRAHASTHTSAWSNAVISGSVNPKSRKSAAVIAAGGTPHVPSSSEASRYSCGQCEVAGVALPFCMGNHSNRSTSYTTLDG